MRNSKKLLTFLVLTGMLILLMAGCAAQQEQPSGEAVESPPQPAAEEVRVSSIVSATGVVVPEKWTTLSFFVAGMLVDLNIEVGDSVEAGQIIARVDSSEIEPLIREAEADLVASQADLARIKAGPLEEEVEAAKQALAAANAGTAAAAAQRDELYHDVTETEIIQAEQAVREAQELYNDLQQNMDSIIKWADTVDIADWVGKSNPLASGEMLAYQIELAELSLQAAQAYLDDLLDGPDPDVLRIANARVWIASAQAEAARARMELLEAGAAPQDIALYEAEVGRAEATLEVYSAQLERTKMIAPFDATVTELYVNPNEFVPSGLQLVQLADLTSLYVETTDLNEIDVARVKVGDAAIVTFDALPGVEVTGTVTRIAPKSSEGTGVNFTVYIELDEIPEAVRWGMTAFVDIEVE